MLPPLFSRYRDGQAYGSHVDNALQRDADTQALVRTDVSVTLFLNDPSCYTGGELIIQDAYGEHADKLAAGDAVIYPANSVHRVAPVSAGTRLAMVTWAQSLVKDAAQRAILHDLDIGQLLLRQTLQHQLASDTTAWAQIAPRLDSLTQVYHNLLRQWAEV